MATNFDNLSMSAPKDGKGGMRFQNLFGEDGPLCIKAEGKIVYEPSVYNGTGLEERKNIVLTIDEDTAKKIEELERWTRLQAGVSEDKWNSCVKRADGPRLKAKINVAGSKRCDFVGPDGVREPPAELRGRTATVALLVRGIYMQRSAAGLMVDVVAMKYGEATREEAPYLRMVM